MSQQFDFGAFTLSPMSEQERRLLGHWVGSVLINHLAMGQSLSEVLETETRRLAKNARELDFLTSAKRALLASGDFRGAIEEGDFQRVVAAVYASGGIDPIVLKAIWERAGSFADVLLAQLEATAQNGNIFLRPAARPSEDAP